MSILIYEVLKLIRGTRAVQMALGGGLLVALFYGSRWGHLETVNWLIRNLVGYIVFAVIVLFQSDIRRALAHFGRAPFFRYFAKAESAEESIEELVVAASMLSSQRIGAIIALERQIGLRNYIEGGIRLDAVLTYDLLISIFLPLVAAARRRRHRAGRPRGRGRLLPAADRESEAEQGARVAPSRRHRADGGERLGGDRRVRGNRQHLDRRRRPDRARAEADESCGARLRSLVLQRRAKSAAAREVAALKGRANVWPFRHLGLKLLSVALAVLLWMVVSGEETVERGLRVPLELQQVPAGLELLGEVPATVDVRVRGASGTLSRVGTGDVVAVLDLHGAQSGRRLFPLTPDQVRVPFGVEVVQVTPSAVAMAFEASASRQVPVVPAVDGRPAPGYVVGPLTADPPSVDVIGPESAVKRATEVLTEPVSVAGARDQVRQSVILGLEDPSLRLKTARSAMVTVQILPAPLERTFRNRPVHLRNLGAEPRRAGRPRPWWTSGFGAAARRSTASRRTTSSPSSISPGSGPANTR